MTLSQAYAKHPDHTITVEPHPGRVTVRVGDAVVAESGRALVLREAGYPPVFYIPREDCRMALFEPTDRVTHCPFKGDARYWTVAGVENAAWAYDAPFAQVASIAGHVAFAGEAASIETG